MLSNSWKRVKGKLAFKLSIKLVNLIFILLEHEMKICSLNEEHSRKLSNAENRVEEWRRRLQTCEEHLRETRQALEAASRLSAKIDEKESIIEQLKQDCKYDCYYSFLEILLIGIFWLKLFLC